MQDVEKETSDVRKLKHGQVDRYTTLGVLSGVAIAAAVIICIVVMLNEDSVLIDDKILEPESSTTYKMAETESSTTFKFINRSEWGARDPVSRTSLDTPVQYIIVHHTDMKRCYTMDECKAQMRAIQNFHMDVRKWSDIGYNFCVGDDGNAYEGRGLDTVGAHATWYNNYSIGICVMGNFMDTLPSEAAMNKVQSLIKYCVDNNKVKTNYILYGHRQVRRNGTSCPGDTFFERVKTWPHWVPGKHFPPT